MQAITTLHAQLCAATEKLDLAQKASNAQDNRIRQLRDENKTKWGEIEELTKMLSDVMDDEKLEKEKLEDLLVQIIPLELECQRKSGHVEILPAAFKKLTDDFMDESRETMFKIEDLLSLARRENFWKSKIAMNMYHINADRIRLRQQKLTLSDAHLAEVSTLNKQLADEEYLLAMVQARFDTAEKKKVQQMTKPIYQQRGTIATSGRGGSSSQSLPFQKELIECLPPENKTAIRPVISGMSSMKFICSKLRQPHDVTDILNTDATDEFQSRARPAYGAGIESIYSPTNQAVQHPEPVAVAEVRCHGCHKYGHFFMDCPNCYKCGLCNKHHLNGSPCSSKALSSSPSSANYDERGLGAPFKEINKSPSSFPTPGPTTKSYEAIQGSYGSFSYPPPATSAVVTPRRPLMSQHHLQQQQYSIPGDGHVTHTVTRTITEVSILHHTLKAICDRFKSLSSFCLNMYSKGGHGVGARLGGGQGK